MGNNVPPVQIIELQTPVDMIAARQPNSTIDNGMDIS